MLPFPFCFHLLTQYCLYLELTYAEQNPLRPKSTFCNINYHWLCSMLIFVINYHWLFSMFIFVIIYHRLCSIFIFVINYHWLCSMFIFVINYQIWNWDSAPGRSWLMVRGEIMTIDNSWTGIRTKPHSDLLIIVTASSLLHPILQCKKIWVMVGFDHVKLAQIHIHPPWASPGGQQRHFPLDLKSGFWGLFSILRKSKTQKGNHW